MQHQSPAGGVDGGTGLRLGSLGQDGATARRGSLAYRRDVGRVRGDVPSLPAEKALGGGSSQAGGSYRGEASCLQGSGGRGLYAGRHQDGWAVGMGLGGGDFDLGAVTSVAEGHSRVGLRQDGGKLRSGMGALAVTYVLAAHRMDYGHQDSVVLEAAGPGSSWRQFGLQLCLRVRCYPRYRLPEEGQLHDRSHHPHRSHHCNHRVHRPLILIPRHRKDHRVWAQSPQHHC